jgi:flagellar basal-body rod protein FlgB
MIQLSSNNLLGVTKALDGLALRHLSHAQNIANINTPNYKPQIVTFEAELKQAVAALGQEDELGGSGQGMDKSLDQLLNFTASMGTDSATQRIDGNGVTPEKEISHMTMNSLKYNALTSVVSKEFQLLKNLAQAR